MSLEELADTLEMWANQIREHKENTDNGLPHPSLIEDWMSDYRDAYHDQ